jgi:hypothetical protein
MITVRRDAVRTQQRKRCVPHGGAVHSKHADGNPMPHPAREAKAERSRVRAAILALRYLRDSI